MTSQRQWAHAGTVSGERELCGIGGGAQLPFTYFVCSGGTTRRVRRKLDRH